MSYKCHALRVVKIRGALAKPSKGIHVIVRVLDNARITVESRKQILRGRADGKGAGGQRQ